MAHTRGTHNCYLPHATGAKLIQLPTRSYTPMHCNTYDAKKEVIIQDNTYQWQDRDGQISSMVKFALLTIVHIIHILLE